MAVVSVCILSQNHEAFIGQLIKSLSEQTEKDFDIYYIDNFSVDQTYEVALKEFDNYKLNVKYNYKNTQNRSIPQNLNSIVSRIKKSEYILIISADDWLTSNSISLKISKLSSNRGLVAVCSSVYSYQEPNGEITIVNPVDNNPNRQFESIILGETVYPAAGAMYRRNILEQVGFFDENIEVEDYDMWLKLSLKGTIGSIYEPLAYYRRHTTNITDPNSLDKFKWLIENVYKSMLKYKEHAIYNEAIRKFSSRVFYNRYRQVNPASITEIINFFKSFHSWRVLGPIILKNFIIWRMKELMKF